MSDQHSYSTKNPSRESCVSGIPKMSAERARLFAIQLVGRLMVVIDDRAELAFIGIHRRRDRLVGRLRPLHQTCEGREVLGQLRPLAPRRCDILDRIPQGTPCACAGIRPWRYASIIMAGRQPTPHRCGRLHSAACFCHVGAERVQSSPCDPRGLRKSGESQATEMA